MSATAQRAATLAAIAFAVSACGLFAAMDTAAKYVVQTIPVLMALCVRYVLQALLSSAWLLPRHRGQVWQMRQPGLLVLRGMLLMASTILAMFSLRLIALADFAAIMMITPVVVTVLSATLLHEHVGRWQWVCVVAGFAGTLFIIQPGGSNFSWATLLPLGCVAATTGYQLLSGHLGRTEQPAAVHFSSMWVGAIASCLLLPWNWTTVHSGVLWASMLAMGLFGALGHFLLTLAYQRASASVVALYTYSQVGFAVLLGWLVFAALPDAWSFVGIALIVLSGIANGWLLRRRASAAP